MLLVPKTERDTNENNGTSGSKEDLNQRPNSSRSESPAENNDQEMGGAGKPSGSKSPQVMMPKKKALMLMKKGSKKVMMESSCNCPELRHVECILETKELWDKFHDLETEMIITKTGR